MSHWALISAGTSEYDEQGRIQGRLDIPLSTAGRAQVEQAAQQLLGQGLKHLYVGRGEPAEETAQILAAAWGLKPKVLDELQNLDLGLWQGMLLDDLRQKQPRVFRQGQDQPCSICPPEGETITEAQQRVQTTLVRLLKKHKGGVAVVVAEPLAGVIRAWNGRAELGELWGVAEPGCRWEWIESTPPVTIAK